MKQVEVGERARRTKKTHRRGRLLSKVPGIIGSLVCRLEKVRRYSSSGIPWIDRIRARVRRERSSGWKEGSSEWVRTVASSLLESNWGKKI